jgi:hypothetical protein
MSCSYCATSIRKWEAAEKFLQKAFKIQARKDQQEVVKQACKALELQKQLETAATRRWDAVQSLVVAQVGKVYTKINTVTSKGQAVIWPAKFAT